jgi:cyclase
MQSLGCGEIIVNSVDQDGTMTGYDLDLAVGVRSAVQVPITLLGGAGSLSDMEALIRRLGVVGAAAGSLFVFKGRFRAVLITYPSRAERDQLARSS